jgi:elongation factor P
MKINGNAIKQGNVIEHKGALWVAIKTSHVKPGKGGAFAQVELKNLRNNSKLNERFRSSETVERIILEEKKASYLYEENDKIVFMDNNTYEQKFISKDLLGDKYQLLEDGMEIILNSFDEEVISIELPDTVTVEILEADAVVKGQTASSSYKPAIIKENIRILVPPHIGAGSKIVIKTEDLSYVERAKD